MNSIHDLGGMHGLGPVVPDKDEVPFRHDWERRIFGLFFATFGGGHLNIDEFRHAMERMDPAHYLLSSYYEHWLHAIELLLLEKGVITEQELRGQREPVQAHAESVVITRDIVPVMLKTGASARVDEDIPARFRVGDSIRVRNVNLTTHTRMPRYVRGKVGRIEIDHGVFVTPDTIAHGLGEHPQHVYSVSFNATELWGADAPAKDSVRIDLWDDYLESAS